MSGKQIRYFVVYEYSDDDRGRTPVVKMQTEEVGRLMPICNMQDVRNIEVELALLHSCSSHRIQILSWQRFEDE